MHAATTVDGQIDLFGQGDQARMYQSFRPMYTEEVVMGIMARVPQAHRDLYVDVACGSGQLTRLVAPYFKKSVGIDRSQEQLSNAVNDRGASLEYRIGSAFELPFPDASVDLVTVAQAFHWFLPYEKAFAEINRVLKPGGVFVTAGYSFPQILEPKEAMRFPNKLFYDILGSDKSPGQPGCWWGHNTPTVEYHYRDIEFPFAESVVREVFPYRTTKSTDHYCNYLRTFSGYRTLLRSGEKDPMPEIGAAIKGVAPSGNLEMEIPFFTVSYTKPNV